LITAARSPEISSEVRPRRVAMLTRDVTREAECIIHPWCMTPWRPWRYICLHGWATWGRPECCPCSLGLCLGTSPLSGQYSVLQDVRGGLRLNLDACGPWLLAGREHEPEARVARPAGGDRADAREWACCRMTPSPASPNLNCHDVDRTRSHRKSESLSPAPSLWVARGWMMAGYRLA
jgi:hypothetical protein